jgi:hypothetical protein
MRRLICLFAVVLSVPAIAAERKGFVWANRPSQAAQYTAEPAYAYNSARGEITIAREGEGTYTVTFAKLAAGATGGGNVQVNSYGGRPQTCSPMNWTGTDNFVVKVRCFSLATGEPADAHFSLLVTFAEAPLVIKPADRLGTRAIEPATGRKVKKTVGPAGFVIRRFPDGRVEEEIPGGVRITLPDGTNQMVLRSTGAPANIPPTPPDNAEKSWLTWHNERLLDVIRQLVENDQTSIENFLSKEASLTLYERIARRRDTINVLLIE